MTRAVAPGIRGAIADAIHTKLGLVFPASRTRALDAGIVRAVEATGARDESVLLSRLIGGDADAIEALTRELTIGETYFFRDPLHFDVLRREVLLPARVRGGVRLWSAGCATGEEPYSLAMAALELGVRPEVVATDVNPAFLERARRALYGAWSFRGVPQHVRRRWFTREGRFYRVADDVRACVRFETLNLVDAPLDTVPKQIDAAFCRNVLIYFGPQAVAACAERLAKALVEGGLLVTGPSDPLLEAPELVTESHPGVLTYRRRTARHAAVPAVPPVAPPLAPSPRVIPIARRRRAAPSQRAPEPESPPVERAAGASGLPRARILANAGDRAGALRALDAHLASDVLDAGAWVLRATLRQEAGDDRGALDDLRRALLLDRGLAIAHLLSVTSLRRLGDEDAARGALLRARRALADVDEGAIAPGTDATFGELRAIAGRLASRAKGTR